MFIPAMQHRVCFLAGGVRIVELCPLSHVTILDGEKALLLLTTSFGGEALLCPTGEYALHGRKTLLLGDGTVEGFCSSITATLEEIFPSSLASVT